MNEELIRAEKFIKDGKYNNALEIIRNFEKRVEQNPQDNVACHLLECEILYQQGLFEDLLKIAEKTYDESLRLGPNLLSVDTLMWKARALIFLFKMSKVSDIIKQGEELLESLTQEIQTDYKRCEALIAHTKGNYFYFGKNDVNQAVEQFEHNLTLQEKFGTKEDLATAYIHLGWVLNIGKGKRDQASKFVNLGLDLAKEIDNKFIIGQAYFNMATSLHLKGELLKSIHFYEESLTIFKDFGNNYLLANCLNNLADVYNQRGELSQALMCIEKSLKLRYKTGTLRDQAMGHDFLIKILIEMGDLDRAQHFLHDFEQLNNQLVDSQVNAWYLFDKALILKKSLRSRSRVKAEDLLKQILEMRIS